VKIVQSFTVARPAPAVWTFFQDVPAVAACLPGAELVESTGGGLHRGKVAVKLGPFNAAFEGEAKVTADAATRSGHVEGRGTDKRGGSHSQMALDYKLDDLGSSTKVDIDVNLTLSGPIAQFGRTGLVTEVARVLIADFVRNLEARISEEGRQDAAARPSEKLNALSLLLALIREWVKRLFTRRPV
jgi:carbon monoxide dehydrogenase subunit G